MCSLFQQERTLGIRQRPGASGTKRVRQLLRKGGRCGGAGLEPGAPRLIASAIPRAACDQVASALGCLSQKQMSFFSHGQMQQAQNPGTFLKVTAEAITAAIPNLSFTQAEILGRCWPPLHLAGFQTLRVSPPTPSPRVLQRKGHLLSLSLAFGRVF